MGSIMSREAEIDNLYLKDFQSKRVKECTVIRVGETILFKDKSGCLYEARPVRNEKWARPMSARSLPLVEAAHKLGLVSAACLKRVKKAAILKQVKDEIKYHEDSIRSSQETLAHLRKELEEKENAIRSGD